MSKAGTDSDAAAALSRSRTRFKWWKALAFGLIILGLVAGGLVFERKPIAALLVQAYLLKYGIASSVEFEELSRGGFVAHVRTGPETPKFSADILDVTLDYDGFFALPQIGTVRLVHPVLRASFDGEHFSFGSLQPLVDEALAKQPEGPGPSVTVEQGMLYLTTPAGLLQFTLDASVDKGKLNRLTAALAPSHLANAQFRADIKQARFAATVMGDKLDGAAGFTIDTLSSSRLNITVRDVDGTLNVLGVEWRKNDAILDLVAASASVALRSASLASQTNAVMQPDIRLTLENPTVHVDGSAVTLVAPNAVADARSGRIASPEMSSDGSNWRVALENTELHWAKDRGDVAIDAANVSLIVDAFKSPQGTVAKSDIRLDLKELKTGYDKAGLRGSAQAQAATEFRTIRAGGYSLDSLSFNTAARMATWEASPQDWSVTGPVRAVFDAETLRFPLRSDSVTLASFYGAVDGSSRISATGITGAIHGSLTATGTMPRRLANALAANVPVAGSDPKLASAIANALIDAKLQIPDFNVSRFNETSTVRVGKPISVIAADGVRVEVSPEASRPLAQLTSDSVDGGFGATAHGGGLPEFAIQVPRYRVSGTGRAMMLDASTALRATLDYGAFQNVRLSMDVAVQQRNGVLNIVLNRCADVELGSYDANGTRQISAANGQVCSAEGTPVLQADNDGWRLRANWSRARAKLEQAQSTVNGAEGRIALAGDGSGIKNGRLDVSTALLADAQASLRFRPITAAGSMSLSNQEWRGAFDLASHQRKLAAVQLRHLMNTGVGSAEIQASDIAFDPMFQPTDISPLLAPLGTRVRGHASFSGRASWNTQTMQSSGIVHIADVDVQTPLGMARGARGDIALTSLVPIALAPNQTVTVSRIDWPVPVEGISARFSWSPEMIQLESVSANLAGGHVSLDPLTYSFTPGATTRGTLHLEHIDLAPLIAAAGLANKVQVTARMGGTLPFMVGPDGLRFANGHIAAESPGHLSIQRTALTAAVGTGANGQAQPNAVQDFAYQALENLSFTELNGEVNSRPMGRLGVLFHVKGQHDPAVSMETRVGVVELLQGHAFDKPLPLPKGTPIDLTLDTSVNLDELLASYFGNEARMNAAGK